MSEVKPLDKDIYNRAKAAGITSAYAFDGNGDGSGPYGFDVTYNLENGLVSMETWETGEVYDAAIVSDLAINEED